MPYFSTMLQSIIEYSSAENNYDIIVFHRNITEESQTIIHEQCKAYANITVRFYDILPVMQPYMDLHVIGHFTIEMYFRLLAPYILKNYDKVLYLDSDIIVQADVAKLYNIELNDEYLLAACKDADFAAAYNAYKTQRKYAEKIIKLQNPYNYFQSGIILFNLKIFRETLTTEYIMELARSEEWHYPDQDVLNNIAQDKVLFLDMTWNMIVDWRNKRVKKIKKHAPKEQVEDYLSARECPYIIHYAGPDKPWLDDSCDLAENWWQYAKNTPYYESLQNSLEAYKKEQKKFKNRFKRFIKKLLMPFVNLFFPYGSKFREKLKKKFGG